MKNDKIRLGIIGCGGMAKSHESGAGELTQRMEVTAVCDIVPERAKEAAEVTGAKLVFTDYTQMVEHVDAVLIVLPHHLHYQCGSFFLNHGKHVLMEKPMCNTERECIQLMELAEEKGLVLMTAYPVRYWPIIQKMKELVDNKTYGEVFQMSIWTEQYTHYEPGHWGLSAKTLGGGQFFSHGCHYVDLLLWFLGEPVRGVHMGSNYGVPWMEKEGTSNATIEFKSGAMGYHFGTWGARGTKLGYSFHIHCTNGMLEYSRADRKLYLHQSVVDEKPLEQPITTVLMEEEDQGKKTEFETLHFLDCIQRGVKPMTDAASSLQGLRVIWRMYDAEQNSTMADLTGLGLEDDWRAVPLRAE